MLPIVANLLQQHLQMIPYIAILFLTPRICSYVMEACFLLIDDHSYSSS